MNLLITGSASQLAKTCIPVLLDDTRIKKIVGIDLLSSEISHPDFEEHILDIRSNQMSEHLHDIDAVIHFAFVVNNGVLGKRRNDREYIRDVNVEGSRNVFNLAISAKVKSIIHFSSAIVYGLSAENPTFIDESHSLVPVNGFYYSEDKIAVEQILNELENVQKELRIVRLRPHVVMGQNAQPLIKSLLQQPFHFLFPDPQPLTQCISEMDVASALQQALFLDVSGSFNLATDQVASFHWIHKHLHQYSFPLPLALARFAHRMTWKHSGHLGDPAWLDCMRFPLTISNDKAKTELKWTPTLDLFECLEATV